MLIGACQKLDLKRSNLGPPDFLERFAMFSSTLFLLAGGVCLLGTVPFSKKGAEEVRVGFAQVDISPKIGEKPVYIAGFGQNRLAKSVHDPLFARAMVLEDKDGKKIGVVCADVVGLFYDFTLDLRSMVKEVDHLIVTSTHNHNGPDTLGLWGPAFAVSGVDKAYIAELKTKMANVVKEAATRLKPCKVRAASISAEEFMRDSREPYLTQPELTLLTFDLMSGQGSHGFLLHWNCHPETVPSEGPEITADFVGPAMGVVEKKLGCKGLYLTGTVGGLMTTIGVSVKTRDGKILKEASFEKMEALGQGLGQKALLSLEKAETFANAAVSHKSSQVMFPVDNPVFKLGWKLGTLARPAYEESTPGKYEEVKPSGAGAKRMWMKTEVGILKIGDADLLLIPGEIYPELVLGKIQDPVDPGADYPDAPKEPGLFPMLDGKFKMLVGLANDEIGYIIPRRQWDEKPPFCYKRTKSQYGEINSMGSETAPRLSGAVKELLGK